MDIAAIRVGNGITQQMLADEIGVTRQMISAIENGANPSVETAKAIAAVLGFDWTLFFPDGQESEDDKRAMARKKP